MSIIIPQLHVKSLQLTTVASPPGESLHRITYKMNDRPSHQKRKWNSFSVSIWSAAPWHEFGSL